ncbi:hypothetical protein NE237_003929 [Protea cynaroides]|uniref:Protein BIC1 n=1 Tax=Protea cynaroides TaxID=273540 RepID=A0A9Q0QT27_9MAGN|nr:hypothetical protein NE237_003929 [Protea cynaroides]
MSDRNLTEPSDQIPSTPSKPEDSNDDKRVYLLGKQSTIQESKDDSEAEKKKKNSEVITEDSGREKLKRHRKEVAGHVWIPEIWGKEEFLKDWMDCSAFNASLVPSGIVSARAALIEDGQASNSGGLRIENRCRVMTLLTSRK